MLGLGLFDGETFESVLYLSEAASEHASAFFERCGSDFVVSTLFGESRTAIGQRFTGGLKFAGTLRRLHFC